MNIKNIIGALVASGLTLAATGCKEESKTVADQTKDATSASANALGKAADAVKETGNKVLSDAKTAGEKAAQDVADKAKEVAAPANAKAQELIAAAKGLIGEGKFQDALTKLKAVGSEKLSVDQQAVVDTLKTQIEKALSGVTKAVSDGAGAGSNPLGK